MISILASISHPYFILSLEVLVQHRKQGSHRPEKVLEFDLGPGKLLEFEKKYTLSWNFVESSLKYELVLEKSKIRVLSDLWDLQKKLCENHKTE